MRDIRFRGKRIDSGEWHFGDIRRFEDSVYIADSTGTVYQVDPDTVGQYVCLKDKDGQEMFEGDIVRRLGFSDYGKPIVGPVLWIDDLARFALASQEVGHKLMYMLASEHPERIIESDTIIGNVWDNPELLEVAQ